MITTAPAPVDAGSPTGPPPAGAPGVVAWYAEGFSDALGDRLRLFDNAGPPLELLRFSPPVAALPGFESSVRARINALATFSHPAFAKVRALTLLDDPLPQLALVSELVTGERLSTVLRAVEARGARLDPTCAIWLLRHLLPALAAFHDATGGASHRLLDADRVVVTPTGEIAITEYVFGGLPEDLLPAPRTSDVGQAALLAVVILLGRPLRPDERDANFERLVQHACTVSPSADVLRPWLTRALSAGPDRFMSVREAYHALDELLPGVWGNWPSSRQLPDGSAARPGAPVQPGSLRLTRSLPALPAVPSVVDSAETRRLWRVNRTLVAVAMIEAVCIAVLIARGAMSGAPAPRASTPTPPIQTAGFAPAAPSATPALAAVTAPPAGAAGTPPAATAHLRAPGSVIGWLVIESAVEVKVYVNGRLLGVATRKRFGVPAGDHTITLVNNALNFRSSQPVHIVAGRSVLVAAKLPEQP